MGSRTGSGKRGFTLVEVLIVLTIVSILISVAIPLYAKSVKRSKETVLKNNLFTLRVLIDEYTMDKGKAPMALEDLVREGYIRRIPQDPMTQTSDSWQTVMEEATASMSQSEPGIYDVKSGSSDKSLEGTPYNEW
jgi:general secretion pathway protein G